MIASGVASGCPRQARRISSHATRAAMRYAARIGSTDWLLRPRSRTFPSAVLLDEGQHAAPRVVASLLPLGEGAVEEAMRGALIDVHLVWDVRLCELLVERVRHVERGRAIVARDQQQERRFHLRDERLASRRPSVKANYAIDVRLQRGLVP